MLADLRPEGHVAAGDLRCQIVDQPLRRLQPARPDPVPVAAAGPSAVCVVLPPDRIASFTFEGLLDNEPGRQLHQLGPAVRRCEPALDQIGKGLARTHRRRYSLGHGVPPCWRRRQPAPIAEILSQDAPLPNFPATLGLHRPERAIVLAAAAIVCLGAAYAMVLPVLFGSLMGLSLSAKMAIAVALVAPLGFVMGLPFPLGLGRISDSAPGLVPWAWGINGCASVVAAVMASLLAMHFGFTIVLALALSLYSATPLLLGPGRLSP